MFKGRSKNKLTKKINLTKIKLALDQANLKQAQREVSACSQILKGLNKLETKRRSKMIRTFGILGLVLAIAFCMLLMFVAKQARADVVHLDEDTIVIKGEFNGFMAGKFIQDVSKLRNKEVTVFIDSPGGSISSLNEMLDIMKAEQHKGKSFHCITTFAASAASAFMQHCDTRSVTRTGTLMFHHAAFGLRGNSQPYLKTRLGFIETSIEFLEISNATRMGISLEYYRRIIRDDLWLFGEQAKEANTVDNLVVATCSRYLLSSKESLFFSFLGMKIEVVFSGCPLITSPLEVKFDIGIDVTPEEEAQAREFVTSKGYIQHLQAQGKPLWIP